MSTLSKSAQVRARLDHPVIDSDGHTVEYIPAVLDYMKEIGGARMPERFTSGGADYYGRQRWYRASAAERHKSRMMRPPWWAVAAKNTLDRATATLPKLLHERLDESDSISRFCIQRCGRRKLSRTRNCAASPAAPTTCFIAMHFLNTRIA